MAAHLVTAGGQLTNLLGRKKARRVEHRRHHEKVAPETSTFERVRHVHRACAAIVKCDRDLRMVLE
ncbi:MAG TPA: hypothetical protein VFB39_03700 [Solirubrobacteraceae bacterium]|nr:hypothetical protein [Solirubrobacteraceae bacterium]